ncbi:hypothetical protein N8584_02455 [bacterium]|nr:hypothetical protein [bacterium]MDA7679789.1 hypothetical protein [bacterium]
MKKLIRIACLCSVAIGFSSRLIAEEYITLTARVDPEGNEILTKTAKDFGVSYASEGINELIRYINANGKKLVDEDSYKLVAGEVVELEHMFNLQLAADNGGNLEQVEELNGGNHSWQHQNNYSNGAYNVKVKFPFEDKWFEFKYNESTKDWSGLNTSNPLIIGPCELKLTQKSLVQLFRSYSHNDPRTKTRFGYTHHGGVAWLSFKKRVKNSSTASTKAQSIVLPEGSGDLSVIMEGSNDLINWTREDLGEKPEANRKTFYRIRAVKE